MFKKNLKPILILASVSWLPACTEQDIQKSADPAIPVVHIHTENGMGVTSKEDYVNCEIIIDGKDLYDDFQAELTDEAKIRGRGNSTWKYYDKKSYRIKLDSKEPLLGMGSAKSWVLLANYRDPTHFMNAVSFDMARYMDLPFANTNRFVEVYLDNEYIGMYQFTEQVQQGENRVAIDEDTGILLSLDLDDGPYLAPDAGDNFYSEIYELPVCVKNPEDLSSEQLDEVKTEFAKLEQLIRNRDYQGLARVLDIGSLIDFLILQEMTRNVELVSPRSMYLFRDDENIWHFGPAWDFDGGFAFDWASMTDGHNYFGSQSWLMGSSNPADHPGDAYNYIPDFFVSMFGNPIFVEEYRSRWTELNNGMLDYCFARLDGYAMECDAAMARNFEKWPIDKNYTLETRKMKEWLTTRASNYSRVVENY